MCTFIISNSFISSDGCEMFTKNRDKNDACRFSVDLE